MNPYNIEVCVDSFEQAQVAENKGAQQIELCGRLDLDGLTPDRILVEKTLSKLSIYTKVMVRPRGGDFEYNNDEIDQMMSTIAYLKTIGVNEIVLGALKNNKLDIDLIKKLAEKAYPMLITIHKAIDYSIDPLDDIMNLKSIPNVKSILTSGQALTAAEGIHMLISMKKKAGPQISIVAAGKITPENIGLLHEQLNLNTYHGRNIL